ncbi:unnamed protein product [Hymenolepis diminuta]|uniref:Uncharacterized protein n=1 Tax=Hymenolepis diminuta TaxID=6216 RepID=A0A564XXL5_HYMDI|nr:unnamed protein product [Hymenolepis diminuta]
MRIPIIRHHEFPDLGKLLCHSDLREVGVFATGIYDISIWNIPLFSLWGDYFNEEKEQVARESRAKVVAIKHTSQRPCRGNTTLRKIYRPVGIRQLPATGRKTTTASLANVYTSSNSAPVGLPSHRPFEKIVVDATPATPRPQPPTVRHLPQQRQFKYTRLESAYMRLIAQQQSSQN